jgi:DNA-binding response OmpR family regulator
MDDPPSEENELVVDIFIASTDGTLAAMFREQLEKNHHRVTIFTDDTQLSDTLLTRKPDLLIYDGSTGGWEKYAVIRRIKADADLWSIPVLALSAASNMDDLLTVLECNADNFIAPPYDSPDHLSLIEGMLTGPPERPTPEDLKKQFKVRENDRTYIVTAPRRTLLEYLLSSFEAVVTTSSELSCVNSKVLELSESVKGLEETVTRQNEVIETLNATNQEKGEKIIELSLEGEGLKKTVEQKTDEIERLGAESDTKKTSLDTIENALMEEKARSASLEKTVGDLTSEIGELQSRLVTEKNRSESAEKEIDSLKQAKIQSEHDLNQVIAGLDEAARQHSADLARLRNELEGETSRRASAEKENTDLQQAKKQSEHDLNQVITGLNESLQQRAAELVQLKSELEGETRRRVLAEKEAGEHRQVFEQSQAASLSEREALTRQVSTLQEELTSSVAALATERELRRVSGEKIKEAAREQQDLETRTRSASEEMERVNKDQAAMIRQLKEELETAGRRVRSLETEVSKLSGEKSRTEQDLRSLHTELEETRTALVNEQKGNQEADDGHASGGKERHLVQQPLISPDDVPVPEENLGLVISEVPNVPVSARQGPQSVIVQKTPASLQHPGPEKEAVSGVVSGNAPRVFSGVIPGVPGNSSPDSIFVEPEPVLKKRGPFPGQTTANGPPAEKTGRDSSPKSSPGEEQGEKPAVNNGVKQEKRTLEKPDGMKAGTADHPFSDAGAGIKTGGAPQGPGGTAQSDDISFSSTQWLDLLKWAHHSKDLPQDQRLKIVRMGRLIQKDRKLTKKQQEQVREILSSAAALGYRSP